MSNRMEKRVSAGLVFPCDDIGDEIARGMKGFLE